TARPQRVDVGLEVLLVDHEVVGLRAGDRAQRAARGVGEGDPQRGPAHLAEADGVLDLRGARGERGVPVRAAQALDLGTLGDRKSTRLNSSHVSISYAVFCLKKKN